MGFLLNFASVRAVMMLLLVIEVLMRRSEASIVLELNGII